MKRKIIWTLLIISFSFTIIMLFMEQDDEQSTDADMTVMMNHNRCFSFDFDIQAKGPLRIVGLGDSLTVGVGDEKKTGGYIGILENELTKKDCPVSLENFSVKGDKTTDLLQQLQKDDVETAVANAHVIMFTIGANDLVAVAKQERMKFTTKTLKKAENAYAKNIENTLANIRELNEDALIYMIGFYNPLSQSIIHNEKVDLIVTKWNNISKNYSEKTNDTYYVRTDDLFAETEERYLADDHFHPNHLGYKKIAERLLSIIQARSE